MDERDLAAVHDVGIRFSIHGMAVYAPGSGFGPRRLVDFEFVWIVQGECEARFDGAHVDAPEGTVLLARPGMRDHYRWDRSRTTVHGYIHFSIERGATRLPPLRDWPASRQPPPGDVLRPLLHHVLACLRERPAGWETIAVGSLRQALAVFLSGAVATVGAPTHRLPAAVEATLAYVDRLWTQEGRCRQPRLAELAAAAGVSPAHLCRLFSRTMGTAPAEAVRAMRLQRAAQLLAESALSVAEVAQRMGFRSPFHFSRIFAAWQGMAPRAFRIGVGAGTVMPHPVHPRIRRR